MSEEKIVEARIDEIFYWCDCPECRTLHMVNTTDFNNGIHSGRCLNCKTEYKAILPKDKYKQSLQGILDAVDEVNLNLLRITPKILDALLNARKVMEEA